MSKKLDYPVANIRHYLEPGPIVLVTSRWQDATDVMTLGWHTVMEFTPSLVGCIIASGNHSFELIRSSRECVINIPTVDMIDTVVDIGNCSCAEVDKFSRFGLATSPAAKVRAPLIDDCFVNLECKLYDDCLIDTYNYFIFEVVKAHAAASPKHPQTVHYTGDGEFMSAGKHVSRRGRFAAQNL
ncbi:flavin reductase family protein [Herbaspirillum rhizosphaerae]|uniref:flavin reductase family protein n=1 Tax=Herbaspirillum rhizosphaerae TaxID=346179 RepID=UPI00067CE039|nr:flavin reductase family protein [Herbaspirillum rhizosphaerae]